MRVRQLDAHTVNQIAAGEVVERPASVVKELVENALDAGARRIEVELRDAGRTLIRVTDDGHGMGPEDALLALSRHATSKIGAVEDLASVRTLGFRGEALPSIASVSRMTLATSPDDEGLRTLIRVDGGEIAPPGAVAGPRGTEIRVEDLFHNVPARLKFLKSDATEVGQALDHVSRAAAARPDVAFRLVHNGQTALETPGRGDPLETLAHVWNRETARTLVPIETERHGIVLRGFVSPPHVTKPTRAFQYLWVNGRTVRSRQLGVAVDVALRDITPERRFPLLALDIGISPEEVDVNVSPTKSEVRFRRESDAFDAIRAGLKEALLRHGMMPDARTIATVNEAIAAARPAPLPFTPLPDFRPPEAEPRLPMALDPWDPVEAEPVEARSLPFASLLDGLRILGQAMNTFIVCETDHGLVVVDQHVAHERILYEYLCGLKGGGPVERQPLLVPQTLHLDRRSALMLAERLDELAGAGFDLEGFGGESFVVRAVPAALRGRDALRMLKDLAEEMADTAVTRRIVPTREQIWIMSSCKMAVKAGDPLSHAEMEKLLVDLATTENPYLCPHGRPITVTLGKDALMRLFKRT